MISLAARQRISFVVMMVLACLVVACAAPWAAPTVTPVPTMTPLRVATPTSVPVAVLPTATLAPAALPQLSPATVTPGLSGVVWKLQRFEYMSGKVTAIDRPDTYTLEFLAGGKVQVKADCNTGSGTYQATGDRLTIANIGLTKMACPAGSQGDKFAQSLGMAISYVLDGAQLTISMSYDAGDMVFGK